MQRCKAKPKRRQWCVSRRAINSCVSHPTFSFLIISLAQVFAELAKQIMREAGNQQRVCLIGGGETTVTLGSKVLGKGGRNQEMALRLGLELAGTNGITALCAGTDGTDGPTDAAGGIVDGDTIPRGRDLGLDAEKYLEEHDSYRYLEAVGGLFITGPTGTNVMDITVVLCDSN